MKKLTEQLTVSGLAVGLLLTATLASAAQVDGFQNCTTVLIGDNRAISSTEQCYIEPGNYTVAIHEVGLCTSLPEAPSTQRAIALSPLCTRVFVSDQAAGSEVLTRKGVSTPLTGSVSRPPSAQYSYAYVIMEPYVKIKTTHSFSAPRFARRSNLGDPLRGPGPLCWSMTGNRFSYSEADTADLIGCGTAENKNTGLGPITNWINSLEGATAAELPSEAGTLQLYLLNQEEKLATSYLEDAVHPGMSSMGNVKRLLAFIPVATTVTDEATGLDISFNVSQGASVEMYPRPGDLTFKDVEVSAYAVGPFAPRITVKGISPPF